MLDFEFNIYIIGTVDGEKANQKRTANFPFKVVDI